VAEVAREEVIAVDEGNTTGEAEKSYERNENGKA
jgi:hypothetical protein